MAFIGIDTAIARFCYRKASHGKLENVVVVCLFFLIRELGEFPRVFTGAVFLSCRKWDGPSGLEATSGFRRKAQIWKLRDWVRCRQTTRVAKIKRKSKLQHPLKAFDPLPSRLEEGRFCGFDLCQSGVRNLNQKCEIPKNIDLSPQVLEELKRKFLAFVGIECEKYSLHAYSVTISTFFRWWGFPKV